MLDNEAFVKQEESLETLVSRKVCKIVRVNVTINSILESIINIYQIAYKI